MYGPRGPPLLLHMGRATRWFTGVGHGFETAAHQFDFTKEFVLVPSEESPRRGRDCPTFWIASGAPTHVASPTARNEVRGVIVPAVMIEMIDLKVVVPTHFDTAPPAFLRSRSKMLIKDDAMLIYPVFVRERMTWDPQGDVTSVELFEHPRRPDRLGIDTPMSIVPIKVHLAPPKCRAAYGFLTALDDAVSVPQPSVQVSPAKSVVFSRSMAHLDRAFDCVRHERMFARRADRNRSGMPSLCPLWEGELELPGMDSNHRFSVQSRASCH